MNFRTIRAKPDCSARAGADKSLATFSVSLPGFVRLTPEAFAESQVERLGLRQRLHFQFLAEELAQSCVLFGEAAPITKFLQTTHGIAVQFFIQRLDSQCLPIDSECFLPARCFEVILREHT